MKVKSIALGLAMVTQTVVFGAQKVDSQGDSTHIISKSQNDLIVGEATKVLYTLDGQDSTTISLGYAFFAPSTAKGTLEPYQVKFNELVYENTLWETLSNIDEEPIRSSFTADFFHERMDSVAEIFDFEQMHYEYSILWELDTYTEVYDFKHHIGLTISNYSYTGGAHGGSYMIHYLIDRSTGELLELKDLFTNIDAVNSIAEVYFRELFEMSEEEDFIESDCWFPNDEFSVNDNFRIQGNDIVFHFNEYEIAPYCYGSTEVVIPLEELRPYMTEYLESTLD